MMQQVCTINFYQGLGFSAFCLMLLITGCQATEFCHNERFEKTCLPGSVVVMTIARYGIMNMSRCVDRDYGYVGCATDVMAQADRLCSGRAACTIAVPNSDLDNLQRMCPKDLKSYLTAEATCWPVHTASDTACVQGKALTVDVTSSVNLASSTTQADRRGSHQCPWLVRVPQGQRINVTLYDFTTIDPDADGVTQPRYVYANMGETDKMADRTVYAGSQRVRHVMTSRTNQLKIHLTRPFDSLVRTLRENVFLLHIQAFGCLDPSLPSHMTSSRQDDVITVTCLATGSVLKMTCQGNNWEPAPRPDYCTTSSDQHPSSAEVLASGASKLPLGLSAIVLLLTAVALGITILVIGLVCIKRKIEKRSIQDDSKLSAMMSEGKYAGARDVNAPMLGNNKLDVYQHTTRIAASDADSGVGMYQQPENEYAFIADVTTTSATSRGVATQQQPPPPPPLSGPFRQLSGTYQGPPPSLRYGDYHDDNAFYDVRKASSVKRPTAAQQAARSRPPYATYDRNNRRAGDGHNPSSVYTAQQTCSVGLPSCARPAIYNAHVGAPPQAQAMPTLAIHQPLPPTANMRVHTSQWLGLS